MTDFKWAVIGAGPAGIVAVGKLIDKGIDPKQIAWIDPYFQVGDLGRKWSRVSSNTKVELFTKFLKGSSAFEYEPNFEINSLDPHKTCELSFIVDPLQTVTETLMKKVETFKGFVSDLALSQRKWKMTFEDSPLCSENVILAVGAMPKRLAHPNLQEIPLEVALDPDKLSEETLDGEAIAVFGSSHSSIIVLRNLLDHPVKKIINFYLSPLKYAVYLDDWILFDNTGLKGTSAVWARENIDGVLPDRLERIVGSDPDFQKKLATCSKVVYTIGFEARETPVAKQIGELIYNQSNGIIAPGLFGLGIAFPQKSEDRYGNIEYNVGLWKFMKYLEEVLPLWMRYCP